MDNESANVVVTGYDTVHTSLPKSKVQTLDTMRRLSCGIARPYECNKVGSRTSDVNADRPRTVVLISLLGVSSAAL